MLLHKKWTYFYLHSRKGDNSSVQKNIDQQSCSLSVRIQGKKGTLKCSIIYEDCLGLQQHARLQNTKIKMMML